MHSLTNVSGPKRLAVLGMLLAFALILSYVESLFPIPVGIPGIKLGLPNLAIVIVLCFFGSREALIVNIMRVLLAGFMFGSLFSIMYSMAGGLLSLFIMAVLMRTKAFGTMGISIAGGFSHNVGQLLMAGVALQTTSVFYYFPILAIGGVITGALIGIAAHTFMPAARKIVDGFYDSIP